MVVEKWDMQAGKVTSVRAVVFAEKKAYIFPLQRPMLETEMGDIRRAVEGVMRAKSVLVLDPSKGAKVEAAPTEALERLARSVVASEPQAARGVVKPVGEAKPFPKAVWDAVPPSVRENIDNAWTEAEVEQLLKGVKTEREYSLNAVYQKVVVRSRNHTRALIQLLAWRKMATLRKVNERKTIVTFHKQNERAGPIEGPPIDKDALNQHALDRRTLEKAIE